jgi:hypothetical protein
MLMKKVLSPLTKGGPNSRVIPLTRDFHLDNLGAHIGHHHTAVRPGKDAAQVDYEYAIQRFHLSPLPVKLSPGKPPKFEKNSKF